MVYIVELDVVADLRNLTNVEAGFTIFAILIDGVIILQLEPTLQANKDGLSIAFLSKFRHHVHTSFHWLN